jgi:hypothetical protein
MMICCLYSHNYLCKIVPNYLRIPDTTHSLVFRTRNSTPSQGYDYVLRLEIYIVHEMLLL